MASSARGSDDRTDLLRAVLEITLVVALQSEASEVPGPLRPYLQMRDPQRVPRALRAADRAGDDQHLRGRVAQVVGDEDLAPAEVLWLRRPDGWEDELEALVSARRSERQEADALRLLDRERRARAAAEADRDRADARADEAEAGRDAQRAAAHEAMSAREEAAADVERAQAERAAAVASLKELEGAHARAHDEIRDLRSQLDAARSALPDADPSAPAAPEAVTPPEGSGADGSGEGRPDVSPDPTSTRDTRDLSGLDREALARAVDASVAAAADLAASLGEVAAQVARPEGVADPAPGPTARPTPAGPARARPPRRRPAALPGGVHDDSARAADHLVRLPGVAVLVDGYNASMASWPGLDIEAQRRRLIGALTRLEARCGAEVTVVFDGVDGGDRLPPGPGRRVRVEFTPGAVEADDVIIEQVRRLPPGRPVVVVSDDRRVRDGAAAGGANLVTTAQLRALIGSGPA